MGRPRATAEQRAAQRERIRLAARSVSEAVGVENVSVRAVAACAGVSQGTIYSYFTNLSELLRSLWLDPVNAASRRLERLVESVPEPRERIRTILEAFVEFAISHPDVHRNAMLFVRPASQERPETMPAEELPFYRLLVEAIVDLEETGHPLHQPPRRSAELLWAGVHGALGLAINADIYDISSGRQLAPDMIELLMRSLSAPAPAPASSSDRRPPLSPDRTSR